MSRPRLARVARWLGPSLVLLAFILAFFWRIWTPIAKERRAFGWDAQWEYWGDLQFLHDALRDGAWPLWNPFDRLGYPFHADPQAGVLYPVNWLLVGISFVTGPVWWLITVKIVAHFWIAALGLFAFLRRRRLPDAACYAGACFWILSYPWSHAMFSALNWGMAWAPWLLLAVDWWAESPTRGRGAAVALAAGMAWLAGAPAAFFYTLLVVAPYGVWAIVHQHKQAGDRPAYLRAAGVTAAIAAGLFALMVIAQFRATGALVAHTVREVRDMDFIGTTAFTTDDLVGFLVPRMPMPSEAPYVTWVLVLSVGAVVSAKPDARSLTLLGSAMLGVLIAWGNLAGYLPFLASAIPPFGFFRRAHRFLYVTMLPLAILGAEGLALLAREESAALRRRWGRFLLAGGAIGALVFGFGFVDASMRGKPQEPFRDAYGLAFCAAIVSAWALYLALTRDGNMRRAFLAIATVVLAADVWYARAPYIERNFYPLPIPTKDAVASQLAGVPLADRVYDRELMKFRPGIRRHIRDLGGYEGDPLALSRYAKLLKLVQASPRLLGHANVRWLLEEGATKTKPAVLPKDGLRAARPGVYEVPEVAPIVAWVDAATLVDGHEDEAIAALRGATPGQVAVLERGTLTADEAARATRADGGAPTAGKLTRFSRSALTAEIDAPADGVVVIDEAYFPGWTARVDGAAAKIVPANGAFRGVLVGPGHHVIEMRYPATCYRVLAPLCPIGLAIALALLVLELRRRREAVPA
jgi:hypothetical protein